MGGFKTDHVLRIKMKKSKDKIEDSLDKDSLHMDKLEPNDGRCCGDNEDEYEHKGDYHRGTWGHKADFLLSIIGYSVGVSNIWRFPYLCMRNGGGAFLIPFFFFLIFCGIPLFFLELCLGQFSGVSSIFVWKLCPLFQGLGYLMVIVSALMSWYYITVIVWVLYYFINSFQDPLPWSVCTNSWNSELCIESRTGMGSINSSSINGVTSNGSVYEEANRTLLIYFKKAANTTTASGILGNLPFNESMIDANSTVGSADVKYSTAAKEFWQWNVLKLSSGLEEVGTVQWHLLLCLLVAWILVFFCLMKGVKSVGKVVYVTAVLPYILLTTFLIRGLMLPGAVDGILFYLTPDFRRLADFQVWLEAAIQVFYSLGPAWGGLITMSSYNKFHNNCLRDAIIGSLADGMTSFYAGFVIFSVLGYMSKESGLKITDVADSGPGLALVAYPEAMMKLPLPQLWAVLFFLMLLTLGIDSQFGTFETVSSGLRDAFPRQLGKRKILLTAAICCAMFVVGIPFVTNGGMYVFQLVDWYASSLCVMITSFLECVIVGWLYGADRFSKDVEMMIGQPVGLMMRLCWCIITPLTMLIVFIVTLTQYEPPTYEGYSYPGFAMVIGRILSFIPIIPIPVVMVIQILKTEGSLLERICKLTKPTPDWGPHINKYKKNYFVEKQNDQDEEFLITARRNLLGHLDREF